MRFTKVSQTVFDEIQVEAGILLKSFNPASPEEVTDKDIICATTGGIQITCKPTYTDYGEDIDNVPANTKELLRLDSWETTIGFTAVNTTAEVIRLALGAADVGASDGKITPRMELKDTDFADIWWVGDRSDGGLVACCLKNALSTEGLSLKTTKKGKGNTSCTLKGFSSIENQTAVPMDFYVMEGAAE